MKNLSLLKRKEADKFFERNKSLFQNNTFDSLDKKILDLIKINSIKADHILEIGCANGKNLNQYSKLCNSKKATVLIYPKKQLMMEREDLKILNY